MYEAGMLKNREKLNLVCPEFLSRCLVYTLNLIP